MAFVAKKIFLTKGVGKHRERLSSFELALRNAGIAACNIVRVSSIFPPSCKLIDPAAQLTNLFEKTHDAMAAFELARYFETTGHSADAGRWYATAAGRFRRADWKTKAQEAAVRLGATVPDESPMQRGDDFHLTPPQTAEAHTEILAEQKLEISEIPEMSPKTEVADRSQR